MYAWNLVSGFGNNTLHFIQASRVHATCGTIVRRNSAVDIHRGLCYHVCPSLLCPNTPRAVTWQVTFIADSATASAIDVRWSAGSCGELLEPSCERFEGFARGDRLIATQTVLSNGCVGDVVCTITDVSCASLSRPCTAPLHPFFSK